MSKLPSASPAKVGLSPDRLRRLTDVLQSEIDNQRLPGAVALIARQGKIAQFESLGQQDPATYGLLFVASGLGLLGYHFIAGKTP